METVANKTGSPVAVKKKKIVHKKNAQSEDISMIRKKQLNQNEESNQIEPSDIVTPELFIPHHTVSSPDIRDQLQQQNNNNTKSNTLRQLKVNNKSKEIENGNDDLTPKNVELYVLDSSDASPKKAKPRKKSNATSISPPLLHTTSNKESSTKETKETTTSTSPKAGRKSPIEHSTKNDNNNSNNNNNNEQTTTKISSPSSDRKKSHTINLGSSHARSKSNVVSGTPNFVSPKERLTLQKTGTSVSRTTSLQHDSTTTSTTTTTTTTPRKEKLSSTQRKLPSMPSLINPNIAESTSHQKQSSNSSEKQHEPSTPSTKHSTTTNTSTTTDTNTEKKKHKKAPSAIPSQLILNTDNDMPSSAASPVVKPANERKSEISNNQEQDELSPSNSINPTWLVSNLPFLYAVAVAEFDIELGPTIRAVWPNETTFVNEEEVLDNCFPEGSHMFDEEYTYLLVKEPALKANEMRTLHTTVYFRRILDPTVPRGAIQKSFVAFCNYPFFNFFVPVLRAAANEYRAKQNSPLVLQQLYESLNSLFLKARHSPQKETTFNVFGHDIVSSVFYVMRQPIQEFVDASVSDLIRILKGKVMVLWYALLFGKRVLFVGNKAHELAPLVIAAPHLVRPMSGFTVYPYISMRTEYLLQASQYVSATTNRFLASKTQLYDVLVDFVGPKPNVTYTDESHVHLSSKDKSFGKELHQGIKEGKSEKWARQKLQAFTTEVLLKIKRKNTDRYKLLQTKLQSNQSYKLWLESRQGEISIRQNTGLGFKSKTQYIAVDQSDDQGSDVQSLAPFTLSKSALND